MAQAGADERCKSAVTFEFRDARFQQCLDRQSIVGNSVGTSEEQLPDPDRYVFTIFLPVKQQVAL